MLDLELNECTLSYKQNTRYTTAFLLKLLCVYISTNYNKNATLKRSYVSEVGMSSYISVYMSFNQSWFQFMCSVPFSV